MKHAISQSLLTGLLLICTACGTVFDDGEDCPIPGPTPDPTPDTIPPIVNPNIDAEIDATVLNWHLINSNIASDKTRGVAVDLPIAGIENPNTDLQIFLYDEAKDLAGEVMILNCDPITEGTIMVHGLIPAECTAVTSDTLQGRMVVIANCEKTVGSMDDVMGLKFEANTVKAPLFGAVSIRKQLDARFEIEAAEIPMLQSGAMITVQLDKMLTDAGLSLGTVTLKDANKSGFAAPKEATTLCTNKELSESLIFNPDESVKSDIEFLETKEGTRIAFVPECAAPAADKSLEIELQLLRNGEAYSGNFGNVLYMKNYADNTPYNIVRGNHYIFNIRSLQKDAELEVKVEEWKEETPEDVIFK